MPAAVFILHENDGSRSLRIRIYAVMVATSAAYRTLTHPLYPQPVIVIFRAILTGHRRRAVVVSCPHLENPTRERKSRKAKYPKRGIFTEGLILLA